MDYNYCDFILKIQFSVSKKIYNTKLSCALSSAIIAFLFSQSLSKQQSYENVHFLS